MLIRNDDATYIAGPLDALVRLMSRMHHTEGSDTIEGANSHVDEIKAKIDVHGNVFRDPVRWTGEQGVVLFRQNWRRDHGWRPEGDRATPPPPGGPR